MAKYRPKTSSASPICWCGSNLPYSKCHDKRDRQIPIRPDEIQNKFQKAFSRKYCMHPQRSPRVCSQQLVAAHSVSRSSSLAAIAENGHVMKFDASFHSIFKHNGRLVPTPIGINRASTFTGFCHSHDSQTFSLIDQPITLLSLDQIF